MKPAPFDYERPASIEDACRLLADAQGGATVLAGGQTLMPLLNLRMSQPFVVIDLGAIASLQQTERIEGGTRLGAMVTQNGAMADATIRRHVPALSRALEHVGHHQTRNRGTVGGSIALAEAAAECPAVAVALDATLRARSVRGERTIAARDFYLGPYVTALEPDEILTAIDFPDCADGSRVLFREVAQRPGDFALVGLVGMVAIADNTVQQAQIAWFGMGPTPVRATAAEAALTGRRLEAIDPQAIADLALEETAPFDDQRISAEYRRTVARRIFSGALAETLRVEEPA